MKYREIVFICGENEARLSALRGLTFGFARSVFRPCEVCLSALRGLTFSLARPVFLPCEHGLSSLRGYSKYRHVGMPHMMMTFGTIDVGIISMHMAPRQ